MAGYADYWARRAMEREAVYHTHAEKTLGTMQKVYKRAFGNIEAQARAAWRQLDAKGGSMAEDAEAYYHRLRVMDDLQRKIYTGCKKLENIERQVTAGSYAEVMKEGYYRNMFDLQRGTRLAFDFALLPQKAIEETMLANWKGRNYSKSIWQNTEKLAELTQEVVKAGFLSGASVQTMVNQIDEVMGKGQFVTERLIRSETSFFANQGELRSYEEAGIERYEYLATLDGLTSKTCITLDGEVFLVSEAQAGKNYPPMHAFCRSTTVAYFDDKASNEIQRRARDPFTGKTVVLDRNMKYTEWYDTYVRGKPEAEAGFKAERNTAADIS